MKTSVLRSLAMLLIVSIGGAFPSVFASDAASAVPPGASTAESSGVVGAPTEQEAKGGQPAPAEGAEASAAPPGMGAGSGQPARRGQPGVKVWSRPRTAKPEEAAKSSPEEASEPITGAFGIPLGEPFDPAMVKKVISEGPHTYRGYQRTEVQGTRYIVQPKAPDEDFQHYAVDTTHDGIVYSIRADYRQEKRESKCKKTKRLAEALMEKYGKPRGKGRMGEWYSFKQFSEDSSKTLRMYAHRCRMGMYTVYYIDNKAQAAGQLPAPVAAVGETPAASAPVAPAQSPEAPSKQSPGPALAGSSEKSREGLAEGASDP